MSEYKYIDVGKRITNFRILKKYSVNKLANLAGVSQSYLRDIELGKKNPTVEMLSYITGALDISLKEFFDDNLLEQFESDSLVTKIYKLNAKRKKALEQFLDTII